MINFASDNVTGVAPDIMAALGAANEGTAIPYGNDTITERLQQQFSDLFETTVVVFPVATGTAANALALSTLAPPYGAIYCHAEAHIQVDECGAPELYTGGAKLMLLPGEHGKIRAEGLEMALANGWQGVVHHVQPAAVSLTQATEAGTVYQVEEVAAIAQVAQAHGLSLHMDGARFANAVAHLGCTPAAITWKAGVDVLSFGATKNGAMAAEAVVFFKPELADSLAYRRKRGGHLFSKMRFLSAQLEAYLAEDRWLHYAAHANRMATQLAEGLAALPGVHLEHPVEANELFIHLPIPMIEGLLAEGFYFYRWSDRTPTLVRLVTAFSTTADEVNAFLTAAKQYAVVKATNGVFL